MNVVNKYSFAREAAKRFFSEPLAICGLIGCAIIVVPAIFAPLLANSKPLLWIENGEITLPFWRYLFAPSANEVFLEQFFNFIMLALSGWLICWPLKFIAGGRTIGGRKINFWLWLVLLVCILLGFLFTSPKLDKRDFRALAAEKPGATVIFSLIPYGPNEQQLGEPWATPSRQHIMGLDEIGRDVASRMIYGGRVSLSVGIFATVIALLIGCVAGMCAGYFGGVLDLAVMRVVEVMICFPTFLLLLILSSILSDMKFTQSILIVIFVIGFTGWIGICQLVRGEVLKQRNLPYMQNCRVIGLPVWRTMCFHLLPNVVNPILIAFSFGVAGAVLAESGLSFLGFGVQAPTASWGGLLRQAFSDPLGFWHLTLAPGLALFITVVSFNFIGEGIQKVFNVK